MCKNIILFFKIYGGDNDVVGYEDKYLFGFIIFGKVLVNGGMYLLIFSLWIILS